MKFYGFVLNILNGNQVLTGIKAHTSATNLRKKTGNNSSLGIVNINAYIKFGVNIYHFVLKILSGNKILTSVKDHNSDKNLRKMSGLYILCTINLAIVL